MDVIQKMEAPSGIVLENGYHKVVEGTLKWIESKRRWYLHYTVAHYLDRAARKNKKGKCRSNLSKKTISSS